MKNIIKTALFLRIVTLSVTFLVSCSSGDTSPGGHTFVYEKDGCGGEFTLTVNADGTLWYYEGPLSSYFGNGSWTLEDGIFTMTDGGIPGSDGALTYVNRFFYEDGELIYAADGSDGFLYIEVLDGDKFTRK